MKKKFAIVSIILLVIILLMLFLPMLFKDKIATIVKQQANKQLNATLNFESVGLNMFKSFPDLTLSISNFSIINKAPFKGDTLVSAESFNATIDLWSVIKGKAIIIKEVNLYQPNIRLLVLKDSTANYNITKEARPDTTKAAPSEKNVNIMLNYYSIDNANIVYIDQASDMSAVIKNLNHKGSGDFSKDKFDVKTETKIDELSLDFNGITYLNKVNAFLDMELFANMPAKKFTLNKNELRINNLTLKFDGFIAKPDSNISIDLTFGANRTDFKDIVSLIPAAYSENFADLKSSGNMQLRGSVKGIYNKTRIPSFNIKLMVQNGNFQYPKLPVPVKNVNLDLNITNPGGTADNTVIDMKQLHFELGSDPFDARLRLSTPRSNPYVDTKVNGRLNLGQLKNALPMKGVARLDGIVQADFQAKGNIGGLKSKRIDNLDATGNIGVSNIVYGSNDLTQEIRINQGQLTLTPRAFNLSNFSMNIGQNNINASGGLYNMLGYLLNKGTISGNLSLNSGYLDVNQLMKLSKAGQKKAAGGQSKNLRAVEMPERVDFTMNSSITKLIYDNLTLENVRGLITIRDRRLTMQSLSMNLLGGSLVSDGYYYAPETGNPNIAFNFNIKNMDIGKTYESFVTVKQFVPMAQYIHGNFDARLNLSSSLDQTMMPAWNSFNSTGTLNLQRAEVKNFKPFEEVGNALKIDELKNPVLTNVNPSYQIRNGRFYVQPFSYKVFNYDVTLSGSNGLDKTLDYTMNIQIPAGQLKQQANQAINRLLKKDVNLVSADKINVKAFLKGNINSPAVSTSVADVVGGTTKAVQEQVKQEAQQQLEKKKAEVQKQVEQKTDTLKEQLKKKAEEKLKDIFKKKF
ncbi:MAG: AsmA-like C-terminal region-containing protein [Ignavibacteriales bacterium]